MRLALFPYFSLHIPRYPPSIILSLRRSLHVLARMAAPPAKGAAPTLAQRMGAPPLFNDSFMEVLAERPPLPKTVFPDRMSIAQSIPRRSPANRASAHFTSPIKDSNGRRLPQTIAHRGCKADNPENTMGAFRGAVDVGAHALETDVHITKDNIVVLSHVKPPASRGNHRANGLSRMPHYNDVSG